MARIAVLEQVESLRSEEDVDAEEGKSSENVEMQEEQDGETQKRNKSGKCIPTVKQVHDAFDSFTALRYSQPTHLQGRSSTHFSSLVDGFD